MQLSYNNQSLLATGCYEAEDPGITRMGKQVIKEMNRVGHGGRHEPFRRALDAGSDRAFRAADRDYSCQSFAFWYPALRNKSDEVLKALGQSGGMLGFSVYPHHLKDKSNCTLQSFCEMIARTADLIGSENIGIGTDLCQDQPDSVVTWMRVGRWTKEIDYGEGSKNDAGFPPMPSWFKDNRDFSNIEAGLRDVGLGDAEVAGVMGENWLRFYGKSFGPAAAS